MNITNMNHVEIFIPFLQPNISSAFISNTFEKKCIGKIIEIELYDKKIKNNKNKIRSAKHNYAFIKIQLFDTIIGKNLRNNILENKNTYIMTSNKLEPIYWLVKPYLNIQDRMERGFDLHIKNKPEEKHDEKHDENNPEWYNDKISQLSYLFETQKNKFLSLILPENDNQTCERGNMAPRGNSLFNNKEERDEIMRDYMDIEYSIDMERNNYQKMLESV